MDDRPPPHHLLLMAAIVEGLVGLGAIGLGWLVGYPPGQLIHWTLTSVGWGLVAALPLLAFAGLIVWFPVWPFQNLWRIVDELLVPLFRPANLPELALIALLAGFTEEALFRGVIQAAVADTIGGSEGMWTGLAIGAVLFGLAHPITASYALLATLMGLYLGWLWIASGNLLVPITAHAMYDFLVFVYVVKIRGRRPGGP
jgi:membrane protease YdiL (CAAX protease family)